MLRRYHNMKRGVALLGVVLALLSGVEQTHLLCQLGGCAASGCVDSSEHACHQHGADEFEASPCSDSHRTSPAVAAEKSASHVGGLAHKDHSCPCPPDCWCQRAPQPLELPRGSTESGEGQLATVPANQGVAYYVVVVDVKPPAFAGEGSPLGKTSPERCAALCRFLI